MTMFHNCTLELDNKVAHRQSSCRDERLIGRYGGDVDEDDMVHQSSARIMGGGGHI